MCTEVLLQLIAALDFGLGTRDARRYWARLSDFEHHQFASPQSPTSTATTTLSTTDNKTRNHGCRQEQASFKGKEGSQEEDRHLREEGLVQHQGARNFRRPRVRIPAAPHGDSMLTLRSLQCRKDPRQPHHRSQERQRRSEGPDIRGLARRSPEG